MNKEKKKRRMNVIKSRLIDEEDVPTVDVMEVDDAEPVQNLLISLGTVQRKQSL